MSANHLNDYKWFVFAQDDTYIIVENLLYYLSVMDPVADHYLGHAVNTWGVDYNVAGPGIVLSRGALTRLYDLLTKGQCPQSSMTADYELGICLSLLGKLKIISMSKVVAGFCRSFRKLSESKEVAYI